MKKIILALFTIFLLSAFAAPKNKPGVKCLKHTANFVVDGKSNDWQTDSLRFDTKTGFAYAFSNDEKMLYVQLKMLNVNIQRKALITGLTLWIDPNGKGKHVLGIKYPLGRMNEQRNHKSGQRPSGPQSSGLQSSGNQHVISPEKLRMFNERYKSALVKLEGFKKAGLENAFAGAEGIQVLLQMDTLGRVIYEAAIPLKMIFHNPEEYLSKDKPFSVLFETGYIQMNNMARMQGHGGMGGGRGGMGGGQGGMGGRGMGGGQRPNPSQMAMMQSMSESSRLKLKTVHLFQGN